MKFLENIKFAQLTSDLTDAPLGNNNQRVINGRIEAYSMKRAGTDKKYAHALGEKYQNEIEEIELDMAKFQKAIRQRSGGSLSGKGGGKFSSKKCTGLSRRNRSSSDDISPRKGGGVLKQSRRARSASFDTPHLKQKGASLLRSAHQYNNTSISNSPLGDFHESVTRRLMTNLILTLNASFPDYDFSNVRPSHFTRLASSATAMNRTNEKLSEYAATSAKATFLAELWKAIDDAITLSDCDVYSYTPPNQDGDDDPLGFLTQTLAAPDLADENGTQGSPLEDSDAVLPLWTLNYFFVNKTLKRIVIFTCVQTMRNGVANDSATVADEGDAYEEEYCCVNDFALSESRDYAEDGYAHYSKLSSGEAGNVDASSFAGCGSVGSTDATSDLDFDMDADGMGQAVPLGPVAVSRG